MSFSLIIAARQKLTQFNKKQYIVCIKVYYKTDVGTWRFREALKKLIHNNANTRVYINTGRAKSRDF